MSDVAAEVADGLPAGLPVPGGEVPVRLGGPAPVAKILFPPAQGLTDDDAITVRGVAADPNGVAAIRVNGVLASSNDGYATWQAEIPLADGDNAIVVETEDRLGHVDSAAATASIHLSRNRLRIPAAIAWDPMGERILVMDNSLDALVAVNPATGVRTILSDASTGTGIGFGYVMGIAWDPVHAQVLVADWSRHGLLAVDPVTGNRTMVAGANVGTGPAIATPFGVAWDPVRNRALVAEARDDALLSVDVETGDRTVISDANTGTGPSTFGLKEVAWDPVRNRALVMVSNSLMSVDMATGDRRVISDATTGAGPRFLRPWRLTWDPVGNRVLVADLDADALFAVDMDTGYRTIVSNANTGAGRPLLQPRELAWDPVRNHALLIDEQYKDVQAVDPVTGDRTLVSGFSIGAGLPFEEPDVMAWDAVGNRVFIVGEEGNSSGLFAVDLGTGERTVVATATKGTGPALHYPKRMVWDGLRGRVLLIDYGYEGLLAVDVETGDRTVIDASMGTGPVLRRPQGLVLDPGNPWSAEDDRALVIDGQLDALVAVNMETGDRTVVSGATTGTGQPFQYPSTMTWDPIQRRALVFDGSEDVIMTVDLATGDRAIAAYVPEEQEDFELGDVETLAWDGLGNRIFIGGESFPQIPSIDMASGTMSMFSGDGIGHGPRFQDPYGLVPDPLRNVTLALDGYPLEAVLVIDNVTGDRVIVSR